VTHSHVLALRPEASSGYRRASAREWLRERFWVLPAVLPAAGALLALVTVAARHPGIPPAWLGGLPADPGETPGALGIIASSTLTFLGVVVTLTHWPRPAWRPLSAMWRRP
jgi:hypothetical protein